jgi:hypothetical protein
VTCDRICATRLMPNVRTCPKGLVFISCGQVTVTEKQLGKDVCALVERLTPYIGYFAENQGSLEAMTKYILANLDKAIGLIAIMHPRGTVTYTDETGEHHQHVRASVWIEQEIAIAAYITQLLGREINLLCYAHRDIVMREGVRAYLPLNPIPFTDDAEIINDLTGRLPSWKATPRPDNVPVVPDARTESARFADEAAQAKQSFLRAIGMELGSLEEQIESLKNAVDTRPPLGARGVSQRHTLALRTSVYSTQLGKLKQVDDPLVLSVMNFYSDLDALQQVVDNTNAAGDAYDVSDAHDGTRGKTTPVLEAAVVVLKKQISTSLTALEKLRGELKSGGYSG